MVISRIPASRTAAVAQRLMFSLIFSVVSFINSKNLKPFPVAIRGWNVHNPQQVMDGINNERTKPWESSYLKQTLRTQLCSSISPHSHINDTWSAAGPFMWHSRFHIVLLKCCNIKSVVYITSSVSIYSRECFNRQYKSSPLQSYLYEHKALWGP